MSDSDTRIIEGACANPNEENIDRALRPTKLADYVFSDLPVSAKRRSPTSSPLKWA